jgi:enamine deaminase RidA (YjgF/YER057c/UK114 family)
MGVRENLKEMGIELTPPRAPMANYLGAVRSGNLVFVSGHGPVRGDGSFVTGKLGRDLSVEQGYEAAKLCALACLSSLSATVEIENVVRVVKLLGMVNCTPEFERQPQVMNGASDLLVAVFGEAGRHARSAVGMQSLPANIAVEVEMVIEVT